MSTVSLTLDEIFDLAKKTLLANGCDDETASILSDLIRNAERDGSVSHGLFRLPAYVSGLKSGKINGKGKPEINKVSASVIKVKGNNCLAPVVLSKGLPELAKAAKENGVAVLAINNSHHMAAMWPETEKLAEEGLVAFACTSYKPAVAPAGAIKPLFGTNPISFAWPRPGKTPVVYDMATASMAMGEVKLLREKGTKFHLELDLQKMEKKQLILVKLLMEVSYYLLVDTKALL
jgi:delta1-piperideine-2-carboxylate reductase